MKHRDRTMFNESAEKQTKSTTLTIVEEEEPAKKNRPPDLSGFTILDERWKGSSSEDSDDSLPVGSYISTGETPGRFCKSVDFRQLQEQRRQQHLQQQQIQQKPPVPVSVPTTPIRKTNPPIPPSTPSATPMASGGSRFKIVPVETRDPFFTRVPKHACPPPVIPPPAAAAVAAALKKEEIVNRSSRSLSDIHPVPSATVQQKMSLQQPPLPKPVYILPKVTTTPQKTASNNVHSHTITNGSPAQVAAQATLKNGATSESLKGLEKSLTNNTEPRRTKRNPLLRAKTVVAASPPVPHHNSLNIDSKIEQAMDLVKTHLMFAVREEVDGLRSKIYDLENHVHRLESENAILRRTIPNEILQKIHMKL
ncbi:unnamed protein product [Caenorhabditis angaria]|uniref:Uncharacterized protein n=1 Tax=Caenorhabditis angaria TaxID=860376 RepID=A0A9P1J1T2_9PELO|nr:unnamed protein product [Caenorhabditis angaria]